MSIGARVLGIAVRAATPGTVIVAAFCVVNHAIMHDRNDIPRLIRIVLEDDLHPVSTKPLPVSAFPAKKGWPSSSRTTWPLSAGPRTR